MLRDKILLLVQTIGLDIKALSRTSWTTATRPSPVNAGKVGFNTSTGSLEFYNGSGWSSLSATPEIVLGPEMMTARDIDEWRVVGAVSARTVNSFTTTGDGSLWWEWCTVGKKYRFTIDFTKTNNVSFQMRNNTGGTSEAALLTSTNLTGILTVDFTAASIGVAMRLQGASKLTANSISLREIL